MVQPSDRGVDEDRRRRFEADWVNNRPRPIAEYLPAAEDAGFLATLEELVLIELEFVWQRWSRRTTESAANETVPRPSLIETYVERFPQLAQAEVLLRLVQQEYAMRIRSGDAAAVQEYRQRFPQLSLSAALLDTDALSQFEEQTAVRERRSPAVREAPLPRPFGHFELLAEIGRGGMGIVYRARQVSAQRDVALKVISPSRLADVPAATQREILQRFRTEAQAAARLQHDHLVTVYEVGEIDGQPYYAMRYVVGRDLAELVHDGPLENRRAAAYLEAVAGAVHAAHQAGILHRDLKPKNVLIDAATDRPLVTDFGLAKFLETEQEDGLTRTGEVLGTPSFMAPEQIRHLAHAERPADVYSLGATLYYAVTGRPPFQAASVYDTMDQVCEEEPLAPQRLNPSVDRDLNTICLRCLEKDPAGRYGSAQELADELRRYREGRPILARPVSRAERMLRWSRRNPWTASLGALSVVLAVLMLVVGAAGYAATVRERNKFEESYQQARRAVEELYIEVSENTLLHRPGMHDLRNTLLRKALGYYQWFLTRRADDVAAREELAATHFRVGLITAQIDSTERALGHYEQARALQQKLCDEQPHQLARLAALADTLNSLGTAWQQLQRWDESQAAFERALTLRERVAAADPKQREPRRKLANTLMNLGIVGRSQGDFDEATRRVQDAQARRRQLLAGPVPADATTRLLQRDFAKGDYTLATLALAQERPQQAVAPLEAAIQGFTRLCAQQPEDFEIRALLTQCHRLLGDVRQEDEQWEQAEHHYRLALDEAELLARENPQAVDFRHAWATLLLNLGRLQARRALFDDALGSLGQARDLLQPLATAKPSYRRDLATTLRELAVVRLHRQENDAARELLIEACQHLRGLVNECPQASDYAAELRLTEKLLEGLMPKEP